MLQVLLVLDELTYCGLHMIHLPQCIAAKWVMSWLNDLLIAVFCVWGRACQSAFCRGGSGSGRFSEQQFGGWRKQSWRWVFRTASQPPFCSIDYYYNFFGKILLMDLYLFFLSYWHSSLSWLWTESMCLSVHLVESVLEFLHSDELIEIVETYYSLKTLIFKQVDWFSFSGFHPAKVML